MRPYFRDQPYASQQLTQVRPRSPRCARVPALNVADSVNKRLKYVCCDDP